MLLDKQFSKVVTVALNSFGKIVPLKKLCTRVRVLVIKHKEIRELGKDPLSSIRGQTKSPGSKQTKLNKNRSQGHKNKTEEEVLTRF